MLLNHYLISNDIYFLIMGGVSLISLGQFLFCLVTCSGFDVCFSPMFLSQYTNTYNPWTYRAGIVILHYKKNTSLNRHPWVAMKMSFVRKVLRKHDKLICVLGSRIFKWSGSLWCDISETQRAEFFEYSATKTQIRLSSFLYTGVQCNVTYTERWITLSLLILWCETNQKVAI